MVITSLTQVVGSWWWWVVDVGGGVMVVGIVLLMPVVGSWPWWVIVMIVPDLFLGLVNTPILVQPLPSS